MTAKTPIVNTKKVPVANKKPSPLKRRSKSTTDLEPLTKKQSPKIKTNITQKALQLTSGHNKRIEDFRKPPEGIYKTKFLNLNDKYASLNRSHEITKEKIEEFDKMKEQFKVLKLDIFEKDCEIQQLKTDLEYITTETCRLKDISSQFSELQKAFKFMQMKYEQQMEKNRILVEKIDILKDSKVHLQNICNNLETDITIFKEEIEQYERIRRQLNNTIEDMKGNIKVLCTIKTDAATEKDAKVNFSYQQSLEFAGSHENVLLSARANDFKLEFHFDRIMGTDEEQTNIFGQIAQLIQSSLKGFELCFFTYGQDNSGHTWSVQGEDSIEKLGMYRPIHYPGLPHWLLAKFVSTDLLRLEQHLNLLSVEGTEKDLEINQLKYENREIKDKVTCLEDIYSKCMDLRNKYESLRKNYNSQLEKNKIQSSEIIILKQSSKYFKRRCGKLEHENSSFKEEIFRSELLRRQLHNTIQDLKGNIRVFCRIRPAITTEEQSKAPCRIYFPDENTLEIKKKNLRGLLGKPYDHHLEFHFDKVFSPECSQEMIFEELAPLVQSALDGYHVCVLAYGQTGSGKTYTMLGRNSSEKLGIIPRTIDLIFKLITKLKTIGWSYKVEASFLEIYNETIIDLLEPSNTDLKELRYNEGRGVTVTNLTIKLITTADEMKKLMQTAKKNRAVTSTQFNVQSSRSHTITRISLDGFYEGTGAVYIGSVNLVDLAGSESAKTCPIQRLTETKSINKSLSNLGKVMLALYKKDAHVPYRDSKLTYLLQNCLGGNAKALMFVNISPFEDCYNESLNSLRFATMVREVKMAAKRNKSFL